MPGVLLTILVGPTVPVPVPATVMQALDKVEVTHSDEGRSGFELSLFAGRGGPQDVLDSPLLSSQLFKAFNRVVIIVTFGVVPKVLMDGFITNHQLTPGSGNTSPVLTVTGEDVSVMMDLEEKSVEHPAQDETMIATKIIGSYAQYGIVPSVIPPTVMDMPIPIERTPVQQGTDLAYLKEMAERHAYDFYVTPGPAPLTSTAYWGPPKRTGLPQRALSANLGPDTNVESIQFRNDGLAPTLVEGEVQDRTTNSSVPVQTLASTRTPLVSQPAWLANQPNVRRTAFREPGLTATQAHGRAQAQTDASVDATVTATGEMDALRYGDLLQPRGLVDVRGVGYAYDGTYYVKSVTHEIRHSAYKQRFTLTREGTGALSPVVRPT